MVSVCCMVGCAKKAEWEIWSGDGPDDYTQACTEHVGALLTDARVHHIYRIPEDI